MQHRPLSGWCRPLRHEFEVHAYRSGPGHRVAGIGRGLRGLPADRRYLGAPARVPDLRSHRLLRQLAQPRGDGVTGDMDVAVREVQGPATERVPCENTTCGAPSAGSRPFPNRTTAARAGFYAAAFMAAAMSVRTPRSSAVSGTTRTGAGAEAASDADTEPRSAPRTGPRPREPTTISRASASSERERRTSTGSPTSVSTAMPSTSGAVPAVRPARAWTGSSYQDEAPRRSRHGRASSASRPTLGAGRLRRTNAFLRSLRSAASQTPLGCSDAHRKRSAAGPASSHSNRRRSWRRRGPAGDGRRRRTSCWNCMQR